jgi:hypothetical protein
MSTTSPIRNQCSQSGTIYTFKSKSNSHLSLKILRSNEGAKKITFTADQLEKISFQQEMLAQAENLPKLLEVLYKYGFLSQKSGEESASIEDEKLEEDGLLKPLEENPLNGTHPLGVCLGIDASDPYYKAYPNWCETVQSSPRIREGINYERKIQECKDRMSLQEAEEGLSHLEEEYLGNINRAINKILKESEKEPDERAIHGAIQAIYENVYQLLVMPIKDILEYMKSPQHMFIMNQLEFRQELTKHLPSSPKSFHESILDQILAAMMNDKLEVVSHELIEKYPQSKEFITELKANAELLIKQTLDKANKEIQDYWKHLDINTCFEIIFRRNLLLSQNYQAMLSGRYYSLKEIPNGIPVNKIHYASYIGKLSFLTKACENFKNSSSEIEVKYWKLKEDCKEYLQRQNPVIHFQQNVQPLVMFLQCIKNILAWPKKYELAEGEIKYINNNLYYFAFTTNSTMVGKTFISYDFLSISEQDQRDAEAALKKNLSFSKKREACRKLFHARIPWKALQAIGSLLHRSGGVPENEADSNQRLVRSALLDLIQELPVVEHAIEELIEFELAEFFSNTSLSPPKKLPKGCYANIYLLGNASEINRNMKKIEEVLGLWNNRPLTSRDFATSRIKYAILRTIQILGEISKNLGESGILSDDPIWDCLEELRDLLSHLERHSVSKRLAVLIDSSDQHSINIFSELCADFRVLREYFYERRSVFNKARTWADHKRIHRQGKEYKTYLELRGLQNLYILLTARISKETAEELHQTYEKETSHQAREEILRIRETFLKGSFDRGTYESDIEKLPLTLNQKKELKKAVKIILSPNAAANDIRAAKPGLLKKTITLISEFKKNKDLACSYQQLDELRTVLVGCEKLMTSSSFNAEILRVKELLNQIKNNWLSNRVKFPSHLETVEDNLICLMEGIDDYVERKMEECKSLLDSVRVHLDLPEVKREADSLIRDMQLGQMTIERLELKIAELGLTNPLDKEVWKKTYNSCIKKKLSSAEFDEKFDRDSIQISKKRALHSIDNIIHRLRRLDEFFLGVIEASRLEFFQKDQLLQLACQELVSEFRANASVLEDSIESIRHSFPFCYQFFQEIQEGLMSSIRIGNDILHVHEVTEPSTATAHGHAFMLYTHIYKLIINYSGGKDRDISINSLYRELMQLKEFLSKVQSVPSIRKKDLVLKDLERIYHDLSEKNKNRLLEVEEILKFQDDLARALPVLQGNKTYQQIVEGTEALMISVLNSEQYSQSTSSSKFFFNPKAAFSYEKEQYIVKPTRGEGSCAIHALLGEEIEGVYRFSGESKLSSEAAKAHFTDKLRAALDTHPAIQITFSDVIKGYLNQSPEKDLSTAMLYYNTREGVKLKQQWIDLSSKHAQEIQKMDAQQASLWLPLIKIENGLILDQIIEDVSQITDPTSPYYQKSREEILQILKEAPIRIVSLVNADPDTYLGLIREQVHKDQILELREQQRQLLQQQEDKENQFIFSSEMIDHYIRVISNPAFYLNTNEIKLAAQLFDKKVIIVAHNANGIEPAETINSDSEDEPIVIHHRGEHFSRCLKLN